MTLMTLFPFQKEIEKMENDDDILLWRLAETLTVTQAALLAVDINPADVLLDNSEDPTKSEIRDKTGDFLPTARFRAVYCSILSASSSSKLKIKWIRQITNDDDYIDEPNSIVGVEDLKKWFASRGFRPRIFFPDVEVHEFKDTNHPRYAPKLAAVVGAWEAVKEAEPNRTVKQTLAKWLNINAAKYELVSEDGRLRENLIQELAGIANWDRSGGAPKTHSKEISENKNTKIFNKNDWENADDDDFDVPF